MSRSLLVGLLAVLSATVGCEEISSSGAGSTPTELGRRYTGWLHAGDVESLWERFSPSLRETVGGFDGLRDFQLQVQAELGSEREVQEEMVIPWIRSTIYHRTSTFSGTPSPVWVQWTIEPSGVIAGFLVQPGQDPAPSEFLDYSTRTPLRLPFSGDWFVYWGGRSVPENYHAASPDQRFAYDFLVVRDERTHAGDPSRNESYFCYGMPVLAPGSGVVAAVQDGIEDNVPGQMNEEQVPGNHVVLDHGNGEFSFLAHLQRGSIEVRVGEQVEAGQAVGRCGNSGRSSEPHLHFHLQTSPVFGAGEGLPAHFLDYFADGEHVARGEPTRGQYISPAEEEAG